MIAESIVCKLRDELVILMSVVLVVGKDERWLEFPFQGLEAVFDIGTIVGEVAVAKLEHVDSLVLNSAEKVGGAAVCFACPLFVAAKDDPPHGEIGHCCGQV